MEKIDNAATEQEKEQVISDVKLLFSKIDFLMYNTSTSNNYLKYLKQIAHDLHFMYTILCILVAIAIIDFVLIFVVCLSGEL